MAKATTHATKDDKVHELVDIITEEVSDVDRAANRRTYLVVKRSEDVDDDTLGPELIEEEDGDFTTLDKAEDDEDDDEEEEEGAAKNQHAQGVGAARKQALVLPGPVKKALLRALAEALERLTAVVASIKDADETDEKSERPMPDSVARELQGIQDQLAKLLNRYPAKVTKAGAKLAEKRRRQLRSAIELLQKLFEEVLPLEPSGAPPSVAAAPVAKAEGQAEQTLDLGQMLTTVTEGIRVLTAKMQQQEAEIARLKKSTGLPASREVEARRAPAPPEPVSWPLDMNAPLTRDQVSKDISFFDDD